MRKDNGALVAIAATTVLAAASFANTRVAEGSRAVVRKTADGTDFVTEEQLSSVYHNEDGDGWAEFGGLIGEDLSDNFYYVPSENELRAILIIASHGYEPAETLRKSLTEIRTYGGFGSRPTNAIKINRMEIANAMLTSGTKIVPMLDPSTMLYKMLDLIYQDEDKKYLLYQYASPLIRDVEALIEQDLSDHDIEKAFTHEDGTPESVIKYLIQKGKIKRELLSQAGKKLIPAKRARP